MNKTTDQEGAEGIRTIFDLVARNRYREVLERIARNPDIVNFVNNSNGRTPLHEVAYSNNLEMAIILCTSEAANYSISDGNERTPLEVAFELGHSSVATLLANSEDKRMTFASLRRHGWHPEETSIISWR